SHHPCGGQIAGGLESGMRVGTNIRRNRNKMIKSRFVVRKRERGRRGGCKDSPTQPEKQRQDGSGSCGYPHRAVAGTACAGCSVAIINCRSKPSLRTRLSK